MNIKEAEKMAKDANINGVQNFLKSPEAKEYDMVSIQYLIETLMGAYIESCNGEMDDYVFSNIKRIANMKVSK